jgi:hypothetical protein
VKRFQQEAPDVWEGLVKQHGPGGRGSGKHYSANSRISQCLHRASLNGELTKLEYVKAPPEYGSPVIRVWSFEPSEGLNIFPEEQEEDEVLWEGAVTQVSVNKYERNAKARRACIKYFGAKCAACGFDFEKRYGEHGKGYIQVHHLKPIHQIQKTYKVNPTKDLIPVCTNCHSMIHCRAEMLTIAQIKKIIRSQGK